MRGQEHTDRNDATLLRTQLDDDELTITVMRRAIDAREPTLWPGPTTILKVGRQVSDTDHGIDALYGEEVATGETIIFRVPITAARAHDENRREFAGQVQFAEVGKIILVTVGHRGFKTLADLVHLRHDWAGGADYCGAAETGQETDDSPPQVVFMGGITGLELSCAPPERKAADIVV